MVRVEVDSIRVNLMSQDRVVVLREVDSERYLPIWIGTFEAEAIRIELSGAPVPRPLTHDLLKSVIIQMGGEVEHIVVNELRNDVYYATIRIKMGDKILDIDSRPSDSIALAVRLKVPIYVADSVMERAAIRPEEEVAPTSEAESAPRNQPEPGADEGDDDLSLFSDFLESLDLDDLDE